MAKKKQFDWRTHSKPARGLTAAQEAGFTTGPLRPLLDAVLADPAYRMEIRPRAAHLYRDGVSLLRVTGEGPFIAEVDATDTGAPARMELSSAEQTDALLGRLIVPEGDERPRRAVLHALSSANSGTDLFSDELVIIDTEYNVGQRKVDLVGLRRSEGVTGPGGFANPGLVFADVRCCGQTLTGNSGLAAVVADVAEFAKALSGEHLRRAQAELVALTAQKVRMGLLPEALELRGFTDALPEVLVLFSDFDVADPAHDRPLIDLAEKLAARHYPAALLTFAYYAETPESGDADMALREGEIVSYREFKTYRHQAR